MSEVKLLAQVDCNICCGTGKIVPSIVICYDNEIDGIEEVERVRLRNMFYIKEGYDPETDRRHRCLVCSGAGYLQKWLTLNELGLE